MKKKITDLDGQNARKDGQNSRFYTIWNAEMNDTFLVGYNASFPWGFVEIEKNLKNFDEYRK